MAHRIRKRQNPLPQTESNNSFELFFFFSNNNMYDIIITIFLVGLWAPFKGLSNRGDETYEIDLLNWLIHSVSKTRREHRDERARVKSGFPNSLTGVTKSCVHVR